MKFFSPFCGFRPEKRQKNEIIAILSVFSFGTKIDKRRPLHSCSQEVSRRAVQRLAALIKRNKQISNK